MIIASTFGVQLQKHGHIQHEDTYAGVARTSREGVFVAGAATGPETIDDSIAQAQGAAIAALSVSGELPVAAE